jgi:hypothetical protein
MRTTDNTDTQGTQHPGSEVTCPGLRQRLPTSTLTILTITRVIPGSVRAIQAHGAGETPELDLRTIPPEWAVSPLDQHAHAVDAWADHPPGMWIARCGHRLSGGTPLYDVPQGEPCPRCARWSQATEPRARARQ